MSAEFHPYSSLRNSSLPTTLQEAQALITQLQQKLQWSELQRSALEEQLRLRRIEKYGAGSEKLSNLQLELLEEEPGVSQAEVEAESERTPLNGESSDVVIQRKGKPKKHPGRQTLPAHLPRVEQMIACPTEQCRCGVCGQEKAIIGYEISEQLEVEPAKYFVQVTKREKRACSCGRGGVVTAPVEKRIIEKGLVSDRVVIETLVNKYCSHLPLYRQSLRLKQETGLELSRATMDGWVMQVGEMLMPVVGAMKKELLEEVTCKPMKHRWTCKCMIDGDTIIRPTFGNTVVRGSGGVRVSFGTRARRAETVPWGIWRNFADGWICGLRESGRAGAGPCRMLGSLPTGFRECGEVESR